MVAAIDHPLQGAQSAASIVLSLSYRLIDSPEQACTVTPVLISSPLIYPSFSRNVLQEAP
jgi:hypothetical protein